MGVELSTPLLYLLLNDHTLHESRFGYSRERCGVCSVLLCGTAERSCALHVSAVSCGITMLEGLTQNDLMHALRQAWIDEQVPQCGQAKFSLPRMGFKGARISLSR